jgi:hypothetical protein
MEDLTLWIPHAVPSAWVLMHDCYGAKFEPEVCKAIDHWMQKNPNQLRDVKAVKSVRVLQRVAQDCAQAA